MSVYIRPTWNGQIGWRWMFGAETVPAVLFFLLMFCRPREPSLAGQAGPGRAGRDDARTGRWGQLRRSRSARASRPRLPKEEVARVNFGDLLEPRLSKIVALGVFLAVFQQWCGINVIFNYAQEVFSAAGYEVSDLMFSIVITGLVNLLATFVAIFTVDRFGRRPLMLIGAAGLA